MSETIDPSDRALMLIGARVLQILDLGYGVHIETIKRKAGDKCRVTVTDKRGRELDACVNDDRVVALAMACEWAEHQMGVD